MSTIDDAVALAASHGLRVDPATATVNEAGLDYRVVMATADDGRPWVLRLPRRDDVVAGQAAEARILDLVAPVLAADGIAVPDWRVRERDLLAYPALPGSPGLTMNGHEPVWHLDPASPDYANRLGRLLARLHGIGPAQAAAAGVEVRTPERVRQAWADDVARVLAEFTVAPDLADGWRAWLDDDSCWPTATVMTHGEIYPAHILFDDDGAITGVLDWTTARVDDPARDLAAQYGAAGEDLLRVTVAAYERAGERAGRDGDGRRLVAQAKHLWDASPIGYALFALTTGAEEDRAAAGALLNPGGS